MMTPSIYRRPAAVFKLRIPDPGWDLQDRGGSSGDPGTRTDYLCWFWNRSRTTNKQVLQELLWNCPKSHQQNQRSKLRTSQNLSGPQFASELQHTHTHSHSLESAPPSSPGGRGPVLLLGGARLRLLGFGGESLLKAESPSP